ncbi:MAG: 50S ribosomal protein L33 [Candidatus Kerfeldbacteria bacterium]|nr:50S ribosomal protein L33 [Candidatus Kerfeldbacteria bacterium]
MSQDNLVGLACSQCKRVNYFTTRNKKKVKAKLSLKKFCPWDKKHTLHTEAKLK